MNIYFDIETSPMRGAELMAQMPPFDPESVKVGNIKDPAKIQAKIDESRANYETEYVNNAALDPLTGIVAAIGYKLEDGPVEFLLGEEAQVLKDFWKAVIERGFGVPHRMVGFNICKFDLPFLIRRSWKHRLHVPKVIRSGRYWGDCVVDLRDVWSLGEYQAKGSLDSIARHLGVGAKNGDGSKFADLLLSDKEAALNYLRNDVEMVEKIADVIL